MPATESVENFIGLSITREFIEWDIRGESRTVINAPEFFGQLLAPLAEEVEPPHLVCEHAAGAERAVVAALLHARFRVSIAEPESVCAFAHLDGAVSIAPDALVEFARNCPEKLRVANAADFPQSLLASPAPRRRPGRLTQWLHAVRRLLHFRQRR